SNHKTFAIRFLVNDLNPLNQIQYMPRSKSLIDIVDFGNSGIHSVEFQLVIVCWIMNSISNAQTYLKETCDKTPVKIFGNVGEFDGLVYQRVIDGKEHYNVKVKEKENTKELEKEHSSDIQM
ncbi:11252_t:CDS:2, partial [Dentiscutata heterogama]